MKADFYRSQSIEYAAGESDAPVEIGVLQSFSGIWVVGWKQPNGSTRRLKSKFLRPSVDPDLLLIHFRRWANHRGRLLPDQCNQGGKPF